MYRLACPCCKRDETSKKLRRALSMYEAQMGEVADITLGYLCEDSVQISTCIGVDSHRAGRAADIRVSDDSIIDAIVVAIASGACEVAIRRKKDKWVMHFAVE